MKEHMLHVRWDDGWQLWVECPDADLGASRPCAVWANEDGTEREDYCTFDQYADDCCPEDWLRGPIEFAPVPIVEGGTGYEWHAVAVKGEP